MITSLLFSNIYENIGQTAILYDVSHGQNAKNAPIFENLLTPELKASVTLQNTLIDQEGLKDKKALILFSPTEKFQPPEKSAIMAYLKSGGSLLLIMDEERRTPLNKTEVNDIIKQFDLQFTADAPVRHNCGAIAEKGKVCANKRELPYSGGRSIKGGTVISRVNDEGDYIHSAYVRTGSGGKIILMSDAMSGLLMGETDGVRFSGTGPSDSRYWGKDSEAFMREILAFLMN